MSKSARQEKLIEIIKLKDIDKQEDLVKELNELGFYATQATVSRDVTKLGLVKIKNSNGKLKYALPKVQPNLVLDNERLKILLKNMIIKIDVAKNLVVVKTIAGNGQSCGAAIDSFHIEQIVGSVAGDDTVIVVTKSDEEAIIVQNYIKDLI